MVSTFGRPVLFLYSALPRNRLVSRPLANHTRSEQYPLRGIAVTNVVCRVLPLPPPVRLRTRKTRSAGDRRSGFLRLGSVPTPRFNTQLGRSLLLPWKTLSCDFSHRRSTGKNNQSREDPHIRNRVTAPGTPILSITCAYLDPRNLTLAHRRETPSPPISTNGPPHTHRLRLGPGWSCRIGSARCASGSGPIYFCK